MAIIAFFAVLHCTFCKFEINFDYLKYDSPPWQQLMVVGVCIGSQDAEKVEIATAVKLCS